MNINPDIIDELTRLKDLLNKYSYAYYIDSNSLISDFEYDQLFNRLLEIEKEYPELITIDSPSQRVGAPISKFNSVQHKIPMLSLMNTYNFNELYDFDKRVSNGLNNKTYSYCSELKIDGVSISIIYENGYFKQAVTRGDGIAGEDVTLNVKTIKSLPLKVRPTIINGIELKNFEVRGEIYITEQDFLNINQKRIDASEKSYANPRNLTSGTLKLLNPLEVKNRSLQIICYYLFTDEITLTSQYENIQILKQLGFPTSNAVQHCNNILEVQKYIEKWDIERHKLPFQTDGIVIKLDEIESQKVLGAVARNPRWAIAYKYKAATVETILKDITLQVGRTGVVTPVAEFEPVFLAGSTISRATLHNADFIKELDLRIGDTVLIEKGGEVIPKVTKVILDKRLPGAKQYEFPHLCICSLKSTLHRVLDEANYYCEHPDCPWQRKRRLEHFASRDAMNITGLGTKVVDKLVSLELLTNIESIFTLKNHRNQLINISGYGEKSIDNLLNAIEDSKKNPLYRLIFGFGIRNIGVKTAKALTKKYKNLDELKNIQYNELINLDDFGDKMATSVVDFFSNEDNINLIEQLRDLGLNFESDNYVNNDNEFNNNILIKSDAIQSKKFVFTGELEKITREEAEALVEKLGGQAAKSVSKKTNYVVVGANPGSKYNKALELGIPILSEEDFFNLIENK